MISKTKIGKFTVALLCLLLMFAAVAMTGCKKKSNDEDNGPDNETPVAKDISFTYPDVEITPTYGSGTYATPEVESVENFNEVTVNPVTGARADFIKGVDASMIEKIEKLGGKYYNAEGKEQDIFQILALSGVNFFRVRIWNKPYNAGRQEYGGGAVDADRALSMAKRAKAVGMNVFLDFHYSDIWADPDYQLTPRDWVGKSKDEIPAAVQQFTTDTLNKFKTAGCGVEMVQVGNEINLGMFYDKEGKIDWSTAQNESASFDYLSKILSAGIAGVKSVMPNAYTVIHLANGGLYNDFDAFFGHLKRNNVDYDIIGASYYSYIDNEIALLQDNLNKISEKYGKHVLVAETAYGHSDNQGHAWAQNKFTAAEYEDKGGYVTSVQGQASALRDVFQAVANVPNNLGLGAFYWEPGWLPIQGATVDVSQLRETTKYNLSSWANQGLFSYGGKVLPSIKAFAAVNSNAEAVAETFTGVKYAETNIVLNIANNEKMPATYSSTSSQDRFIQRAITWNAADLPQLENLGTYTVHGTTEDGYEVTATVDVIQNFVADAGYENQTGTAIAQPWQATWTPADLTIAKIERKNNTHGGKANLNWWNNAGFEVNIWQEITGLENGTYRLSVFIQGEAQSVKPHDQLYIYAKDFGGAEVKSEAIELKGWMKWQNPSIEFTVTDGKATIGIHAKATTETWAHLDDWLLVKLDA